MKHLPAMCRKKRCHFRLVADAGGFVVLKEKKIKKINLNTPTYNR